MVVEQLRAVVPIAQQLLRLQGRDDGWSGRVSVSLASNLQLSPVRAKGTINSFGAEIADTSSFVTRGNKHLSSSSTANVVNASFFEHLGCVRPIEFALCPFACRWHKQDDSVCLSAL